jgi:hypothetical protein
MSDINYSKTNGKRVARLPLAPLDRPITFTHFLDLAATRKWNKPLRQFREIAGVVEQTIGRTKAALPLWSFARFDKIKTKAGCLRHDANVVGFGAIVGDRDAGTMTLEKAAALLRDAGIAAFLHTTSSHTPSAPRWHVVCPTAGELPPEQYKPLVARLNRLLEGALKGESFVVSQAFYYGHVQGTEYSAIFVQGDRTIDELADDDELGDDLDRDRDLIRSGDAGRLAYRLYSEGYDENDFVDELESGELAGWVADSRAEHRTNPES